MEKKIIGAIIIILAIIAVLTVAVANQNSAPKKLEVNQITQPTNQVPKKDGEMANVVKKRDVVKLIDGFPDDVSILPNSTIFDSYKLETERLYYVSMQIDKSKATAQQVLDFYIADSAKNGWNSEQPSINQNGASYVLVGRKENRDLVISAFYTPVDDSKTIITISTTGRKN
jgi:hypothetical protein